LVSRLLLLEEEISYVEELLFLHSLVRVIKLALDGLHRGEFRGRRRLLLRLLLQHGCLNLVHLDSRSKEHLRLAESLVIHFLYAIVHFLTLAGLAFDHRLAGNRLYSELLEDGSANRKVLGLVETPASL